jgi:antitoxin component YwqK of YwqJK toxin-antitoxin module
MLLEKKSDIWQLEGKPYSGVCEKKDENGKVVMKMKVSNGKKHGAFLRFAPNGNKIFESEYINGNPTGIFNQYFSDGRVKSMRYLRDSVFIYAGWGVEGILRIIRQESDDTIADGYTVVYDEQGKLQSLFYFDKGIKTGRFITLFPSGRPEMTGEYRSGSPDGTWLKYFPDGHLAGIEKYKEGMRLGTWKYYHENGTLRLMFRFQENRVVYQGSWNAEGLKTDEVTREL